VREEPLMALNEIQQQTLKDWIRSKAIVQCPACGDNRWHFAEAAYVRALLEAGDEDLTEEAGVVKLPCGNCGYVALFDGDTVGIRGMWDKGRSL
jgi:predicted nucleic-acid-binding Zn-ribbon protein